MNKFIKKLNDQITKSWEHPAFSNYPENDHTYTYADVASKIAGIHAYFASHGIEKGDKVGVMGRNTSEWGIVYLATMTYGAVIVPILPDFSPDEVAHILNHSELKSLFINQSMFDKLNKEDFEHLQYAISLNGFGGLYGHPEGFEIETKEATRENLNYTDSDDHDLAVLSYTSGTSGFSKGVMLSYNNLWSNIQFSTDELKLENGSSVVSFLPLAHVFGCIFEFLWPFSVGARIHFIEQMPTPALLVKAFQEVKPRIIFMVPLIIEKIYKKKLQPILETPKMKILWHIPFLNTIVRKKIKNELVKTFGGEFYIMVLGGAALNPDVEKFLYKIDFPFSVGYGMTECGPLISYSDFKEFKLHSCGAIVDRMEVKIDSEDPEHTIGEILTRGENVMLGYYKNPAATNEAIVDGWLHTGDLGVLDKNNVLSIKGRNKNMLLGPSGQNIYPEEIEALLNNVQLIQESVVTDDQDHKLVALVYVDPEVSKAENLNREELEATLDKEREKLNKQLPRYKQLSRIVLMEEEFNKTPKRSIKRFKYVDILKQNNNAL